MYDDLWYIYSNEESALMKLFFNIPQGAQEDASKCILSSNIAEQTIKESVICNVKAKSINADNAIIMNCVAKSITAKPGSICYNIISTGDIILQENEVQVGVYNESGEQTIVRSNLDIDGGIYWDKLALDNKLTYGEIYKLNETADQSIIESVVGNLRESYWNDISK